MLGQKDLIRKQATITPHETRQSLCDSIYTNTYDVNLPRTSVEVLDNERSPLLGCQSRANGNSRKFFTVAVLQYQDGKRIRICFMQLKVSNATANTSSSYCSVMNYVRSRLVKAHNNSTPVRIAAAAEKSQAAGRPAQYIVGNSGLAGLVVMELL